MNIRAEYLVGKQKNNEWAGVYGYRPENEPESNGAEMFVVIRIETAAEEKGLETIAKMLLDELQTGYYSDTKDTDEILHIENAFNKMKAKLEVILSREEEILEKGIDLEIGAAFLIDGVMYLGTVGESKVYVYRNNNLVDISKALVDANLSGFIKTGSLKVFETDVFCIATSKVSEDFELLKNGVENLSIDRLNPLKEKEGVSVLIFADQSLEWNKNIATETAMEEQVSPINPVVEQDFMPALDEINEAQNPGEVAEQMLNKSPEFSEESMEVDDSEQTDTTSRFTDGHSSSGVAAESSMLGTKPHMTNRVGSLLSGFKSKALGLRNRIPSRPNVNSSKVEQVDDGFADAGAGEYEAEFIQPSNSPAPSRTQGQSLFKTISSKVSNFSNKQNSGADDVEQKTYMKVIGNIFKAILGFVNGILNFFKREILGQGFDRTNRALYQAKLQRNRKILVVVLIVAVILIYLGIRDSQAKIAQEQTLQNAQSQLTELQSEFTQLNSQVGTVKSQEQNKKQLFISSLDDLSSKAETQKNLGLLTTDFQSLIAQISTAKDNVQLIKEVNDDNRQLISDVGKVHPDAALNNIVYSNGNIFVSDSKTGTVYKITPAPNSDPIDFAKGLNSPVSLTKNSAGDIIFYDSDSSSAIGKIDASNGTITRFPFLSPAVTGTIQKAAVYSNTDSLYEIHQDHQEIFKRETTSDGYAGGGAIYSDANPPNWKTDPEFSKAIDIAVPYEVYVLIQGGGLRRYLAGGDNELTYQSFTNLSQSDYDAMSNATAFDIDGKYLAVADPANRRVMVFQIMDDAQKTIQFLEQFVYRGNANTFKNIKELAASESGNEIFVLDGTSVIKLNL